MPLLWVGVSISIVGIAAVLALLGTTPGWFHMARFVSAAWEPWAEGIGVVRATLASDHTPYWRIQLVTLRHFLGFVGFCVWSLPGHMLQVLRGFRITPH